MPLALTSLAQDPTTLFIIFGAFFLSAWLKGITGLGFSTLCLPLLALAVDHKAAMPLVIIPSLCSNILVIIQTGHIKEAFTAHRLLMAATLPGLLLGLWLLGQWDSVLCRAILGFVLILYGAWGLMSKSQWRPPRWLEAPVGMATGIVNGITGSQVMPLLPYLVGRQIVREQFITTINLSFTFSSIVMLIGLRAHEYMNAETATVSVIGILPVAAGIWLGGIIGKRIQDKRYRKIVLVALLLIGISLVMRLMPQ